MRTFGKYRLVEPLASGGMADVWRAEATGAAGVVKEVALKLVRGEHAARSTFVRMFVEEARLASRLGHGNVVQVFDFDQVDGRYYIAMELVRGRDLGRVVERARERGVRLGLPRAVQIGVEVARGLAHAHRLAEGGRPLGVVHRDVSPHNVLVSFDGEVKLTDFGIARAMHRAGLSEPGTIKGKAAYMAPEQARGEVVDARADVFSLGVILWELCAGRRLFARDTDVATLDAVRSSEPVSPPSAWNEEVPPELDRVILGALERDPARRTASAQDLGAALAAVGLGITRTPEDADLRVFVQRVFEGEIAALQAEVPDATRVRPVVMAAEPVAEASGEDEAPTRTAVVGRKGRGRWIAGAAGLVVLGGAAAALVARFPAAIPAASSTPPAPAPVPVPATATPAATPTPIATATPTVVPVSVHPERRSKAPAPLEDAPGVRALEVPPRASGQGLLSVEASPFGAVYVDGGYVADTPRSIRLPAGRHRLRIERRGRPAIDELVVVTAGRRTTVLR